MSGMLEKVRRFFSMEDSGSYSISNNSVDSSGGLGNVTPPPRARPNIVNLAGVSRRPVVAQQIVLLEPSSFGEARDVAEALKQKRPIIVNVRKTDKDLAKRIIDFLSGISYAIDGRMHKIADSIYLFAPGTVEVVTQGGSPEYQRDQDSLFAGN